MVIIGVVTQPNIIFNVIDQLIPLPPFNNPRPKIAPITAWVLETGTKGKDGRLWLIKKSCSPFDENKNNVNA